MNERLITSVARAANLNPEKIALVTEKSQMSYSDLLGLVQVMDVQLSTRGVRAGQTVVFSPARGELCLAFALLVSLRSLTGIYSEIERAAEEGLEIDAAVTLQYSPHLNQKHQVLIEPDWFTLIGTLPAPNYENISGRAGNFVHQSSGTTGKRKFIQIPEEEKLRDMLNMNQHDQRELSQMRFMSTSAPTTGWALNKYLPVLLAGGSVVVLGDEADRSLQYIDLYGVTHVSTTPALLLSLLELQNPGQYLHSLKEIEIAGAYTPPSLLRRISELCPGVRIQTAYGASEVGAICRSEFNLSVPNDTGYLGECFRSDIELDFFDDKARIIERTQSGILGVKYTQGHQRNYLGSQNLDGIAGFTKTHFLTGDVIRRSGNSLYYEGRRKNIINLNANKYSLDEIEKVLTGAFIDTAFVPLSFRDEEGLEKLALFCFGPSAVALEAANSVLKNKWPLLAAAAIRHLPELPKTQSGKADVQALALTLQSSN